MSKIDELQKAIDEAAMAGVLMIRKSQMSFDFTAPNPHHVAYTRTNASGTVSNIAAKGAPTGYEYHKKKAAEASAKAVDSASHTAAASAHMEAILQAGHGSKEASFHEEAYKHHMKMATALPAAKGAPNYNEAERNAAHADAKVARNPLSADHHEVAAEMHREAHEAAPAGHPNKQYHADRAAQYSKKAKELKNARFAKPDHAKIAEENRRENEDWHQKQRNRATSQPAANEVKPNAKAIHEHYPWGRLTKVEGKGIRAVLHPEHQEAIGKLQDGDSTRFKDEQGIDWTAKRNGEHVELKAPSRVSGTALRVKHSDVAAGGKQKVWGGTDSADGKFRFRDWETGNEVPNYEGEYTYFSKDGDKSQMHTWIDKHGERNHSHMTKDQYNAKYGEDFGTDKHQALLDGVHKVGNDLLQNPLMAKHHEEIKTMLGQLKDNPHPKHAAAVASQLKGMVAASKPSKNAAKDLKAELESDDFGMTEKGGNGRVKLGKDGTLSVYDGYYYGGDDALQKHIKKWSPGGAEHNYFKDKGYNIEVVGTDQEHNSKIFRSSQGARGHVAVHLKVTKP